MQEKYLNIEVEETSEKDPKNQGASSLNENHVSEEDLRLRERDSVNFFK